MVVVVVVLEEIIDAGAGAEADNVATYSGVKVVVALVS